MSFNTLPFCFGLVGACLAFGGAEAAGLKTRDQQTRTVAAVNATITPEAAAKPRVETGNPINPPGPDRKVRVVLQSPYQR